jgi:putative addiction module component (TIGR02574 family)
MTKNAILEAALKLPPKQRGKLASQLFESLDGPADPDAPALWEAEIKRRVAEARAGKVKGKPLARVIADVRKKYAL